MPISPLPGVYNQIAWGGPEARFDCWVMSSFWGLVASGACKKADLPSVKAFYAAAGVAEGKGGNNKQALVALTKLFPKAEAALFLGTYTQFVVQLARGKVISLSVASEHLPVNYGFRDDHQIASAYSGGVKIMNPLDINGSAVKSIGETGLRAAAEGLFDDHLFHGILFPYHPPVMPDPHIAQIATLTAQLAAANAKLTAANATITAGIASISALQAKITAAKAALGG